MAPQTRTIGRFTDAVLIGRGGFGAVYRADDVAHGRQVAIKVLAGALGETERRRFDRERQTMGRLGAHPNIIPVHESGYTDDGEGYLVMELAPGGSLRDRIDRDGTMPWREVAQVSIAIAGAAQAAHDQGVLHRDIKPDNILIDAYDNPRLTDFGIAAVAGNATATTSTTATLAHAAPEVLEGETSTAAVDVYAIGSTFVNLVIGRPPFHLPGDVGVTPMIGRVLTQPPPDLTSHGVPAAVAAVINRSLAKSAADRQPSAAQFAAELRSAVEGVDLVGGGPPPSVTGSAGPTSLAGPPVHQPHDPRLATGAGPPQAGSSAPVPAGAGPLQTGSGAATQAIGHDPTARQVPPQPPGHGAGPPPGISSAASSASSSAASSASSSGGGGRSSFLLIFAVLAVLAVVGGAAAAIVLGGGSGGGSAGTTLLPPPPPSSETSAPPTSPPPTDGTVPAPSSVTSATTSSTTSTTVTTPQAVPCSVRIVEARTDRFDIQICGDGTGFTQYVGRNRIQDIGIELPACFVGFGLFEALNDGFVYQVDTSINELLVRDPQGEIVVQEAFVGTPFVDLGQDFTIC